MKDTNKIVKFLIPIVSVIIIFESVVLVSSLDKSKNQTDDTNIIADVWPEVTPAEPVADFIFETETNSMKVGKSYKVSLNLIAKKDFNLDAIGAYIKYDPEKLTISGLSLGKDITGLAGKMDNDAKQGLISSAILWDVGQNFTIKTDEVATVLTFSVTPKVESYSELDLVTSVDNKGSVTMIVESPTSEKLGFLKNKLEINATK